MDYKVNSKSVTIPKLGRTKKITGTRLAAILGLDRWNTAFKMWCAITKVYEEPFQGTIYTEAGKTIEPKVMKYLNRTRFFGSLKSPTDIYGENYFNKTFGDFFPQNPIFGGMWDALVYDEDGKIERVIEIKTTKRAEDWQNGVPENYAIQASLYAYLLGVDDVTVTVSILDESDYTDPESYKPSIKNTLQFDYKVSERYRNFEDHIETAMQWWESHVAGLESPEFDETKDADILKELRTNRIDSSDSDAVLSAIARAEELKTEIDAIKDSAKDLEKEYKTLTEGIKEYCTEQIGDSERVSLKGSLYHWELLKTESSEIDKDALKRDGLIDKYSKTKVTYRFQPKLIK